MTRRKIQRKPRNATPENSERDKDQLLCQLELQKTQAEMQLQKQKQLELSCHRYERLYDFGPSGHVTFNEKSEIQWLNQTAASLVGMKREQIIGMPFTLLVAKKHLALFFNHMNRCRRTPPGQKVETELDFCGKDKVKIPMRLLSIGFRESHNLLFQTILIDVRAHHTLECVAQEAKEYAEKIIQTVSHPLLVLDENLKVTLANSAFHRVFKIRTEELNDAVLRYARGGPEPVSNLQIQLRNVVTQRKGFQNFEFRYKSPNGRERILLLDAQPLFRKTHLGPLILLSLEDVTERHEAEMVREHLVNELGKLAHELEDRVNTRTLELHEANVKLQMLSARLLQAQELERRHLARELHDEIGQQITCLQILAKQLLDLAPPPLKPGLEEFQGASTDLLQTVRQLSSELRPQLLDDFGVLAALEWHCKRFSKRTGIKIEVNKNHFREDLLNSFLRNVLFRVVQEALTNVARHAEADHVTVVLGTRKGFCTLDISDKGKGFDVKAVLEKESNGLSGLQERIFLAAGTFKLDSAPGKGTTIGVKLPLITPHTDQFICEENGPPS